MSATRDVGRTSSGAPGVRSTARNATRPASLRCAGESEEAPLEPAEEDGAAGAPEGGGKGEGRSSDAGALVAGTVMGAAGWSPDAAGSTG